MAHSRSGLPPKRRVWRITPDAPQGKYVEVDAPPPPAQSLERPEPGWALSSFELASGLDVLEGGDTVPGDLLDDWIEKPAR